MSKFVKDLLTQDVQTRYGDLDSAVWIELVGVDGILTNQFRRDLQKRKMHAEVVKNSIFRRACGKGKLRPLADALIGPAMLITGGDSAIEVGKALDEWAPKLPTMKLRGALLEGEFLDERAVKGLSKLPSKHDLLARVAAAVRSPGGRLAAAINAPASNIAGCLKALIEKLEKAAPVGGDAPAAAETPADGGAATA